MVHSMIEYDQGILCFLFARFFIVSQSLTRSRLIVSKLDLGSCGVLTCFFINMLPISEIPFAVAPTQAKDNHCS